MLVVCGQCGATYEQGSFHICPNAVSGWSGASYLTPMVIIDVETKEILKRIAVALEKMAGMTP